MAAAERLCVQLNKGDFCWPQGLRVSLKRSRPPGSWGVAHLGARSLQMNDVKDRDELLLDLGWALHPMTGTFTRKVEGDLDIDTHGETT